MLILPLRNMLEKSILFVEDYEMILKITRFGLTSEFFRTNFMKLCGDVERVILDTSTRLENEERYWSGLILAD